MGRSPAKWIKVFFGKKSSRSQASKGRNALATSDRGYTGGKGSPALVVSSPVISEPVLVSTGSNGKFPEVERSTPSSLGEKITVSTSQEAEKQGSARPRAGKDPEKIREEQAAIKAQAAFRGYLARRAFCALRGIIRLQALVRGHLVRRQAVATLHAMQAIVKLQALIRGQRVRCCGIGLEINTKFGQMMTGDALALDNWMEKLATNPFVSKLISSSPAMPLQVQYNNEERNSVYSWLERWTSSQCRKQHLKSGKAISSKSQTKQGNCTMEAESGRSKHTFRKNSSGGVESGTTNVMAEPEKSKRNARKVSSSPVESVPEHPRTELEKVKNSLRKVSSIAPEASDRPGINIMKFNRSVRKMLNTPSDVPDQAVDQSEEKMKKDITSTLENKPDLEYALKSVVAEDPVDASLDKCSQVESRPLQSIDGEQNHSVTNGELNSKEDQICHENQKIGKRRASFPAKTEYPENGLHNSPQLPSYMATTKSSKAKFRGQSSPRFDSDSADRNGITRRHSLPSSTNGKLSSHSPRTQKLVQAYGKGGIETDRSLLSSRDGNERPIQVEWRR